MAGSYGTIDWGRRVLLRRVLRTQDNRQHYIRAQVTRCNAEQARGQPPTSAEVSAWTGEEPPSHCRLGQQWQWRVATLKWFLRQSNSTRGQGKPEYKVRAMCELSWIVAWQPQQQEKPEVLQQVKVLRPADGERSHPSWSQIWVPLAPTHRKGSIGAKFQ